MKIRHREYGEVDGVVEAGQYLWEKNGAMYYQNHGWSEVKEPRYVDVTWNLKIEGRDLTLYGCGGLAKIWTATKVLPEHYRLKPCYWFDLPDNLLHEIYNLTPKGVLDHIQRYKKPCLIVEKEE